MKSVKFLEFGSETPEQESFAHKILKDLEEDLNDGKAFSMSRLFEQGENWIIYPKTKEALNYLEENSNELSGRFKSLSKEEFLDSTGLVGKDIPEYTED